MSFKKYNRTVRVKLHKALRRLERDGVADLLELTEALTKEGFTAPDGSPLKPTQVQTQRQAAGLSARRRPRVEQEPQKMVRSESSDGEVLAELILDSDLDAERKVAMLKSLRKGSL